MNVHSPQQLQKHLQQHQACRASTLTLAPSKRCSIPQHQCNQPSIDVLIEIRQACLGHNVVPSISGARPSGRRQRVCSDAEQIESHNCNRQGLLCSCQQQSLHSIGGHYNIRLFKLSRLRRRSNSRFFHSSSFGRPMEGSFKKKIDKMPKKMLSSAALEDLTTECTGAIPSCHESARVEQSGGHSGCQHEHDALARRHGRVAHWPLHARHMFTYNHGSQSCLTPRACRCGPTQFQSPEARPAHGNATTAGHLGCDMPSAASAVSLRNLPAHATRRCPSMHRRALGARGSSRDVYLLAPAAEERPTWLPNGSHKASSWTVASLSATRCLEVVVHLQDGDRLEHLHEPTLASRIRASQPCEGATTTGANAGTSRPSALGTLDDSVHRASRPKSAP